MKLTLNIFGSEFGPWTPNTFGLHSGQMRSLRKMAHNGSWYNQDGVRVGWGDLSADDFLRIQAALETGESFFVLPESSFWRFVTNIGPTGATSTVNPIIDYPGMDYIKENFRYLITRDGFFYNKAASYLPGPMTVHGLEFLPWKETV